MAIVMSNGGGIFRERMAKFIPAAVSSRRRLQLIAAGQGVAALAAVYALGMTLWTGAHYVTSQNDRVVMNPVVNLSVGQGETLWTLAKRYGNPGVSQLDRVDALAKVNGLSASAMLHPGQRLVVPVENPREVARLEANRLERMVAKR